MKNVTEILSNNQLNDILGESGKTYLLLYKKGNDSSDCAYNNFNEMAAGMNDILLLACDVSRVKDIHIKYHITSAPSLLEFDNNRHVNTFKGCNTKEQLNAIFERAEIIIHNEKSGKPIKNVTVYSTPSCSWCNTLKNYLRKNMIIFSDIDVSRDQQAAEEMVRKSGQQGVPQTIIDGQLVVGFDKKKIDRLLEIEN